MFVRNCPKCNRELSYTTKNHKNVADKKKTICKSCATSGKNNSNFGKTGKDNAMFGVTGKRHPMYGRSCYKIWLEKYGKEEADRRQKIANKKKGSALSGENHPSYGIKRSDETRKRMRLSRIKDIEQKNGIIFPNYNKEAISIIKQKAQELKIKDLQHAENGGEFYIEELGYWVDGYSKEKNVVIEYYEKAHKQKIERDERRQQEITKHLGCKFIVIKE